MTKCNGKCYDCEALKNGEIENMESCAIQSTQRRTFEMMQKLNSIEKIIIDFISESKKGKKSKPMPLEDFVFIKKEENE